MLGGNLVREVLGLALKAVADSGQFGLLVLDALFERGNLLGPRLDVVAALLDGLLGLER